GLWETWMGPNGEEMETAVIITTAARGELARLHERTPVIVPPDAFDLWLDCGKVDAMTAADALFMPPWVGPAPVSATAAAARGGASKEKAAHAAAFRHSCDHSAAGTSVLAGSAGALRRRRRPQQFPLCSPSAMIR